jgi:hypothetical protein
MVNISYKCDCGKMVFFLQTLVISLCLLDHIYCRLSSECIKAQEVSEFNDVLFISSSLSPTYQYPLIPPKPAASGKLSAFNNPTPSSIKVFHTEFLVLIG